MKRVNWKNVAIYTAAICLVLCTVFAGAYVYKQRSAVYNTINNTINKKIIKKPIKKIKKPKKVKQQVAKDTCICICR